MFMTHPVMLFDLVLSQEKTWMAIRGGLKESSNCIESYVSGEKRLGTSEVTRDPQPPKEGKIQKQHPEDVEEGEVYELGKIVTTTGDVDVVEEESHFTSASAHVLIREIMVYNRDLQKIKEDINDVEK
ncbi:uncharacterized protein [Aquarana catesbeiana]|uniref:uncharacterized protein isoform X2 n=1 Tax=Aquarana catesbeiana TaxID=8400 RepID=UPI003CC98EE9